MHCATATVLFRCAALCRSTVRRLRETATRLAQISPMCVAQAQQRHNSCGATEVAAQRPASRCLCHTGKRSCAHLGAHMSAQRPKRARSFDEAPPPPALLSVACSIATPISFEFVCARSSNRILDGICRLHSHYIVHDTRRRRRITIDQCADGNYVRRTYVRARTSQRQLIGRQNRRRRRNPNRRHRNSGR